MKRTLTTLAATALASTVLHPAFAQYAPPPPPAPFPGFINEALRKDDPRMNKWDFGGAVRLRYEAKEGFGLPGVGSAAAGNLSLDFRDHGADVSNEYFMERIRFRAGYAEQWWSVFAEGRSSLVQSDERFAYANNPAVAGTVRRKGDGPESDTIDLHQAFVTLGNLKEFPLSLKVGRQEFVYGEERLIGAFAWNNIGRVFDAAKVRWQNAWFGADFFTSRVVIPEDGRFNVNNDHDWFSGMYATSTNLPHHLLDFYFFARNSSAEAIAAEPSPQFLQPSGRDIYTYGVRLKSKPGELGHWDYTLDLIGQFGDFKDLRLGTTSARLDHEAFAAVAQGGYTFNDTWGKPRLGLEYSFASGDRNPTNSSHGTFENLFPTNHKFYGYMDFVSLQNLHNVRGILQLKPHPRVSLAVEGHGFWLADTHDNFYNVAGAPRTGATLSANVGTGTGYGANPGYSAFIGTELDVVAGYALARYAQLEAGYGHFFHGDYIAQSLSGHNFGSRDADYFYVQLNLSF